MVVSPKEQTNQSSMHGLFLIATAAIGNGVYGATCKQIAQQFEAQCDYDSDVQDTKQFVVPVSKDGPVKSYRGIHSGTSNDFDWAIIKFYAFFLPVWNDYSSSWTATTYTIQLCVGGGRWREEIKCNIVYDASNTRKRTVKGCKLGEHGIGGEIVQTLYSQDWFVQPVVVTNKMGHDGSLLSWLLPFEEPVNEVYYEHSLSC